MVYTLSRYATTWLVDLLSSHGMPMDSDQLLVVLTVWWWHAQGWWSVIGHLPLLGSGSPRIVICDWLISMLGSGAYSGAEIYDWLSPYLVVAYPGVYDCWTFLFRWCYSTFRNCGLSLHSFMEQDTSIYYINNINYYKCPTQPSFIHTEVDPSYNRDCHRNDWNSFHYMYVDMVIWIAINVHWLYVCAVTPT